jgi:hypothetical protein
MACGWNGKPEKKAIRLEQGTQTKTARMFDRFPDPQA